MASLVFKPPEPPDRPHTPPLSEPKSSRKQITPTTRRIITYMRDDQSLSFREIGRKLHIHHSTASSNYLDMKKSGSPYTCKHSHPGCHRRIEASIVHDMVTGIDAGNIKDGAHARMIFCPEVPSRTVRATLA